MRIPPLLFLLLLASSVSSDVETDISQDASDLELKSSSIVGEDMFKMSGGKDKNMKIQFGFGQIIEEDATGEKVLFDGHSCNFLKDDISCTLTKDEAGVLPAVDENGDKAEAKYTRITKTCSLAACQANPAAKLIVRSYIMLNKAYICQPDCEAENQYQSPVFNGTAKWEVEVRDWTFCVSDDCEGEEGSHLKIYFNLRGSKGGKEMTPKKKGKVPFDMMKGKVAERCRGKYGEEKPQSVSKRNAKKPNPSSGGKGGEKEKPQREDQNYREQARGDQDRNNLIDPMGGEEHASGDAASGKGNRADAAGAKGDRADAADGKGDRADAAGGKGDRADAADGKGDRADAADGRGEKDAEGGKGDKDASGGKPNPSGKRGRGQKGDRSGRGKCRNSLSTSFGDEPDDQEEFSLSDDSGTEDEPVIRMFGMAVLDGATVVEQDNGFVGPLVEEAELIAGKDGKKRKKGKYITIKVQKFDTKMVYDPTVDLSPTGGSNGDPENRARAMMGCSLALILAGVYAMLA